MVRLLVPLVASCIILVTQQTAVETTKNLVGKWILIQQRLGEKPLKVDEEDKAHSLTFKNDGRFVYKTPSSTLEGKWIINADGNRFAIDFTIDTNNGKPVKDIKCLGLLQVMDGTLRPPNKTLDLRFGSK